MDKKSIALLVVAAGLYLGGIALSHLGGGQAARAYDERGYMYDFIPPYDNSEERRLAYMRIATSYTTPLAVVVGAAGALWLIVSVLQGKKEDKSQKDVL